MYNKINCERVYQKELKLLRKIIKTFDLKEVHIRYIIDNIYQGNIFTDFSKREIKGVDYLGKIKRLHRLRPGKYKRAI